jgi:hypothetical protein
VAATGVEVGRFATASSWCYEKRLPARHEKQRQLKDTEFSAAKRRNKRGGAGFISINI